MSDWDVVADYINNSLPTQRAHGFPGADAFAALSRLQAENERLKERVEELAAEADALEAALREIEDALDPIHAGPNATGSYLAKAKLAARAALQPKEDQS